MFLTKTYFIDNKVKICHAINGIDVYIAVDNYSGNRPLLTCVKLFLICFKLNDVSSHIQNISRILTSLTLINLLMVMKFKAKADFH